MAKKLFMVAVLMIIALSACNGQGATETANPAITDTQAAPTVPAATEAPAVTETLTAPPVDTSATATSATLTTGTPTVGTPFPTNPPDCTNSASFVADITVPDNTNVAGGTTFSKTWRIGNTGTCVWTPEYKLVYYSEERMGAPDLVPLSVTYPGQTMDISVDLTAPTSTGTHQSNFVIENPAGLIMKIGDDSRLWVVINVTVTGEAASPTAAATTTSATATNAAAATSTSATSAATASGSGSTSTGTGATCLFRIDRTKLTETINALNTYRTQKGLPVYIVNPQLAQAAQRHANDIACNKLYVHTGSDGSTVQSRVADTGYVASSVSENVNGNDPPYDGQGVVNWWINDQGDVRHGQNIVSTTFTEIGVGYAFFEDFGYYVIVFAKP